MTSQQKYQMDLEYALHAFGEAVRKEEIAKRVVLDAERNREKAREDVLRMIAGRPSQGSK